MAGKSAIRFTCQRVSATRGRCCCHDTEPLSVKSWKNMTLKDCDATACGNPIGTADMSSKPCSPPSDSDHLETMPGRPAHSWEAADEYLNSVFDKCDANKDGKLQASELKVALKELSGEATSDEDVELLMARLDMDHDGAITKVSKWTGGVFLRAVS